MTTLNQATLAQITNSAVGVPQYERSDVAVGIVHFGVGGFHRAHQAVYLDTLLASDPAARSFGICGVSLLPHDVGAVEIMNRQDCLYTLLVRPADGATQARVIGSILDHKFAPDSPPAILNLLSDPAIRVVTLTITEGGYFYSAATGSFDLQAEALTHDAERPDAPATAFGFIVRALARRREANVPAFTVLSCDNLHGNGDITRHVVQELALRIDPDLAEWIAEHVAFPNSMVDRITPRTSPDDVSQARQLTGLADHWPVTTEAFSQWVIEDHFPTGRPAWESVGAQMVTDVGPYELMKMRLLNAGHHCIAYTGRLMGYEYGFEAMADPTVALLMSHFQRDEAAKTLTPITGTDFGDYATLVAERFANPSVRDSMQRLTAESSTTLVNYMLPILRDLLDAGRDATATIAVVACWARFLEGRDDQGRPFEIVDRRIDDLTARAAQHDTDLLAVVRDNPMFGDLSDRADFVEPYANTLSLIRRHGTRAALNQLLGGSA